MGLRHHTIILVPHERAQFRKWRISNRMVWSLGIGLALLTGFALFSTWYFLTTSADRRELVQMRSENERLRQANASFESSLRTLQGQLAEYEDRTRKLAIVAGVDGLAAGNGEAGIGGTEIAPSGTPSGVNELVDRASGLRNSLDQVAAKLDERRRWISATPAIAPVRGILTSGFGGRSDPFTGHAANHLAIDIAAPFGKPVEAAADGVVVRAGDVGGGLGLGVFISHGFGVTTKYGHMSRVAARPGQRVHRGDVIGYVGSTGRSTGYHLHYEVLVDGKPVDPLAYIVDDRGPS
ncbi:MAG: M23 family metallopeptidase [Acidobacteriota bacterium]